VMIGRNEFSSLADLGSTETVLQQFSGKKIGAPSVGSIHEIATGSSK